MSEQIGQRELRSDSDRIMRALDEGRSFVVAHQGRVVGELRPLRRDRFVEAHAVIDTFRGAPAVDWDRLKQDLDDVADQEVEPRA